MQIEQLFSLKSRAIMFKSAELLFFPIVLSRLQSLPCDLFCTFTRPILFLFMMFSFAILFISFLLEEMEECRLSMDHRQGWIRRSIDRDP